MSIRTKFIIYLTLVHLLFLVPVVLIYPHNLNWFFLLEAAFLVSILIGAHLISRLLEPLRFLESGAEYLEEENFSTRFRQSGQPEMDRLIRVYNRMIDALHDERLRLGEQRGFLEKLLQATPAAIMTFDFEDKISMVNPSMETLLAMSRDNLIGRELSELDHPLAEELDRLLPGSSVVLPFRGRRRLKTQRSQFKDRGFNRGFVLMEEVTNELRRSEKSAYEKLIRVMSHEVNNTIAAATSLLQTCLYYQPHLPEAEREDFGTAIRVVIDRMSNLNRFMREYADMVRLPEPQTDVVDVVQLLRNIALLTGAECERRRIRWIWDLQDNLPPVPMDKHQMEQVLMNIVKNAMEAIGEEGRLTVRAARFEGQVTVCVADSGRALTKEVRANLFSPFFTTKTDGQGIGLTLVQDILTRHGFDFSLEGGPDRDTEFAMVMPLD